MKLIFSACRLFALLLLSCLVLAGPSYGLTLTFSSIAESRNARIAEDIIREVYQRIGIDIRVEYVPAQRALSLSSQGVVDGELERIYAIGDLHPNLLRLEPPIFQTKDMIFTKMKNFRYDGKASLQGYRIGIVNGAKMSERATQGMSVAKLTHSSQLFHMLAKDRLDIVVISQVTGETHLRDYREQGIYMLEQPIATANLYHYLHKKHRGLLPEVEASLTDVIASGYVDKVLAKYANALP